MEPKTEPQVDEQLSLPGVKPTKSKQPLLELPRKGDWRGGYPKPTRAELIAALEVVLRALKNGWR
jgi:hypothetical protein